MCWKDKLNFWLIRALNQFANLTRFKYLCILLESSKVNSCVFLFENILALSPDLLHLRRVIGMRLNILTRPPGLHQPGLEPLHERVHVDPDYGVGHAAGARAVPLAVLNPPGKLVAIISFFMSIGFYLGLPKFEASAILNPWLKPA